MNLRSKAGRRYAKALHDLSSASSVLDAVAADMARLRGYLAGSGDLRAFVGNYMLPSRQRASALAAVFEGHLHPLVWQFVKFLESKRRLGLLDEVCEDFQEREEARQGIVRGRLTSAFAMPVADVSDLAGRVGQRLGKHLMLVAEESPELLGGGRLQIGDHVVDFSLAARLRRAGQLMMAG